MQETTPGKGQGKTADKAIEDAATSLEPGTYEAEVTGTVEKDRNRPQPTPIGDYRATLKSKA
jgi:hypothetical protein